MTRAPRVAIAGIFIESNAFAPVFTFTPEEGSQTFRGQEILDEARGDQPRVHKEMCGFVTRMDQAGAWEPVPILYAGLKPAGPVAQARVDAYLAEILDALREAMPLDAVYISNHGAMIATEDEDIEGTIARSIRELVGDIPVVTTFDLHANVSEVHVAALDLAVSYREDPHYDQFQTGVECAEGLVEILAGTRTVIASHVLPIVAPNVSLSTEDGPYGEVIAFGQGLIDERIMNVSILAGFAYSDTSKNGFHIIVTARRERDPDGAYAGEVVRRIADFTWDMRARFDWDLTPMDEAVAMAVEVGRDASLPPLFLIDLGDNAGAGGPANTLWMFRALHQAGAEGALIGCFKDPALVQQAEAAGEGGSFDAVLTGDDWEGGPARYECRAEVLALRDAPVIGRRGIPKGRKLYAGPSALLRCGPVMISVTSRHVTMNDPAYVEALGIAPGSFRTIVLKGRGSRYHVAWGDYFPPERAAVPVDTPGRTSPALDRFAWSRLPRPSWPLDRDAERTDLKVRVHPSRR